MDHSITTISNIGVDKSFVDDLNKKQGIVSMRVGFVLRSTEIKPLFPRFVLLTDSFLLCLLCATGHAIAAQAGLCLLPLPVAFVFALCLRPSAVAFGCCCLCCCCCCLCFASASLCLCFPFGLCSLLATGLPMAARACLCLCLCRLFLDGSTDSHMSKPTTLLSHLVQRGDPLLPASSTLLCLPDCHRPH